jgi:putative tryptophan/tyrosine transport system substrate-binding protein
MKRREFIAGLGSAVVWPLVARAQQPAVPVIGFLNGASPGLPYLAAFRKGLGEQGYIEGRNVEILYRWAEGRSDALPSLARDLVHRQVSVVVATGGIEPALAAKSATATIPIVFVTGVDPVPIGLVTSLNRPGSNITGISGLMIATVGKRLELLRELAPGAKSFGFLVNPGNPIYTETETSELQVAARTLGVSLLIANASHENELEAAIAFVARERVGGLVVGGDSLFSSRADLLVAQAIRHAVPAIYARREEAAAGGLMSYGLDTVDAFLRAGIYTGRILKGEEPAELPVQLATKIQLVLNLKTAKVLGLTFPLTLLGRADEVIE